MEVLTSLDYMGMIFAEPARTDKSAKCINRLCHTATRLGGRFDSAPWSLNRTAGAS